MSSDRPMTRKRRVALAFDRAADYDRYAAPQRRAATRLAALVATPLPARPRVLEVGCGTGLLAERLVRKIFTTKQAPGIYLCTDIAPGMVARCRRRLACPQAAFVAMDAEFPAMRSGFDLIVSSMALHWADALPAALQSLYDALKPAGVLAVALPGHDSYREWRDAAEAAGVPAGVAEFPDTAALAAILPAADSVSMEEERFRLYFANGLEFLRALKGLGATVPRAGYRPATLPRLRAVLSALEGSGRPVAITVHILYAILRRKDA